jgi:ribonuclease Z
VPVTTDGQVLELGPTATLSARQLDHRVPTFGYRIDEPDAVRLDPDALAAFGIEGPDVGRLVNEGRLETASGTVGLEQVSKARPGQSMAFVMDTGLCSAAEELADGVDLLVCESTFLQPEADLAARFKHLTARQAATIARNAGARRLLLTHFSARYPDSAVFGDEASEVHSDVVVAEDLLTVPVPPRV